MDFFKMDIFYIQMCETCIVSNIFIFIIKGPVRFGSINFINLKLKPIQIEFFFCFSGLDFPVNIFLFSRYNWFFFVFLLTALRQVDLGSELIQVEKKI